MDTLPGTQLTDMWMANPWMFDPSQQSNKFSNYNNAALPYPGSYNGVPTNAATGQPIQSFLDWQKANPGGTTLNSTPAAPAQQSTPASQWAINNALISGMQPTPRPGVQGNGQGTITGNDIGAIVNARAMNNAAYGMSGSPYADPRLGGMTPSPAAGSQGAAGGAAQGGAAPNNWMAALNALSNPGRVATVGAQLPAGGAQPGWGFQPSGGVNSAWLQQAGAGAGMNQGFLSALRAIQNRPQQ